MRHAQHEKHGEMFVMCVHANGCRSIFYMGHCLRYFTYLSRGAKGLGFREAHRHVVEYGLSLCAGRETRVGEDGVWVLLMMSRGVYRFVFGYLPLGSLTYRFPNSHSFVGKGGWPRYLIVI